MNMKACIFGGFAILVLIALSAPACFGDDWQLFYSDNMNTYYYDKSRIEKPGDNFLLVWQRITVPGYDGQPRIKYESRIELDCKERAFKIVKSTEFDPVTERPLATQSFDAATPERTDLYSSRIDALIDNLCPPLRRR